MHYQAHHKQPKNKKKIALIVIVVVILLLIVTLLLIGKLQANQQEAAQPTTTYPKNRGVVKKQKPKQQTVGVKSPPSNDATLPNNLGIEKINASTPSSQKAAKIASQMSKQEKKMVATRKPRVATSHKSATMQTGKTGSAPVRRTSESAEMTPAKQKNSVTKIPSPKEQKYNDSHSGISKAQINDARQEIGKTGGNPSAYSDSDIRSIIAGAHKKHMSISQYIQSTI